MQIAKNHTVVLYVNYSRVNYILADNQYGVLVGRNRTQSENETLTIGLFSQALKQSRIFTGLI